MGAQQREFEFWGAGAFRLATYWGGARDGALANITGGGSEIMLTSYNTLRYPTSPHCSFSYTPLTLVME